MDIHTWRYQVKRALVVVLSLALGMSALTAIRPQPAAAQTLNLGGAPVAQTGEIILKAWPHAGSFPDTVVRTSSDGTDFGSSPRLMDFDASAWPVTPMLPDSRADSGRSGWYISRGSGPSGYGYYARYEIDIEDVHQITDMQLQVFYDDATILWINGQEVYRTIRNNLPATAAGPNPSITQNIGTGGFENYYVQIPGVNTCESGCSTTTLPPIDPQNLVANPVADSPNALVEGKNVIMAMFWTRAGSDIGFDLAMDVTRDLNAPFPRPILQPVVDQENELADEVNLTIDGITENDPASLTWSAAGLPPGLSINPTTGVITGSVTADGNYSVTVTATDNVGTSDVSFQWTAVNTPPVISNPGPQQTPVLNATNLAISAVDPDGGPVSLFVSGLPDGLTFANNVVSGAPTVEGSFSVTVAATDDEGQTVAVQFPWQIAEPPIEIINPGVRASQFGAQASLVLSAIDPTGGPVVFSASSLPPGFTFDSATSTLSGAGTELGATAIVIQGTGPSGSAAISFTWVVTNARPIVTMPADQVSLAEFGETQVVATYPDPDGGIPSVEVAGMPPGITFDPTMGTFSGTPTAAGDFVVSLAATDNEGGTTTRFFDWKVFPAVDHPIQINEVMASNDQTLLDEDGDSEDWFELHNPSGIAIDVTDWVISDTGTLWTLPSMTIAPNEHVLIFASDKDRAVVGENLHANFRLSKDGDSLLLSDPEGRVIDEVSPLPLAFADVSVGVAPDGSFTYLDSPTPGQPNSVAGSDFVPILRPFSNRLYNVGETVAEQIDGFDPDGDALSYQASLPTGVVIDSATGEISGTPTVPGTWPTTIEIADPDGRKQDQPVTWFIIPTPTGDAGLVLNEYNAVPASGEFAGTPDPAFTELLGNGGDWYEFVVVEDGLDLRGWTLEFWDRDSGNSLLNQSAALQFTNDPFLANLPSGMIITVSEDRPDDLSFDPSGGDWHINLQASADRIELPNGDVELDPIGSYFTDDTQENFNSSRSNQNVIIRDQTGANRTPVVGETEAWDSLVGGVGSGEVMNLCINPTTAQVDPLADYLDNGTFSTYGAPNSCILVNDPADPDDDTRFDQDLSALRASAVLLSANVTTACFAGNGVIRVEVTNFGGVAAPVEVTVAGLAPRNITVSPLSSGIVGFSGRPNGSYDITVESAGGNIGTFQESVSCAPEFVTTVDCLAEDGRITIDVTNPTSQDVTYSAVIDGILKSKVVGPNSSDFLRITGRADGPYSFDVTRNNIVIGTATPTVNCDPAVDAAGGVYPTVTCLAGNGRIDVNVVNSSVAATYEVKIGALASRTRVVAANDWWRSPVTGRPDGPIPVKLWRNGELILDNDFTVACDDSPATTQPEVQLLSVCRNNDGFVAWQFANPSNASRSYVIEFEGVPNRSTTAGAYGAAVRGVSGRPDGDYAVRIRVGSTEIWNETVTVACD